MLAHACGLRVYTADVTQQTREQEIWAKVYERFDPEKPADKPWRVERKYSPAQEIVRELARPMGGHKRFMILGGLGSGKSTELMGIAEARSQSGPVVFLDLVEHFEQRLGDIPALDRVQPWEVGRLAGGGEFGLAKLAASVAALSGGALTGGAATLVGAGLVAVSEVAKSFQFKIGIPGRKPRSDQDQAVRQLLEAVNALIGDLQGRYATRL